MTVSHLKSPSPSAVSLPGDPVPSGYHSSDACPVAEVGQSWTAGQSGHESVIMPQGGNPVASGNGGVTGEAGEGGVLSPAGRAGIAAPESAPCERRFVIGAAELHHADCRDFLKSLPDNSIDSVVTDPPYALVSIQKRFGRPGSKPARDVYGRAAAGFMGKQWDTGETAFDEEFWSEVLRVLKPGGHVASFGGTRTYHRMAVAIEDAGFEIRDQLGWIFGSGFPKSHNQTGDWDDYGTALKPAWEPICLARKSLDGTVAGNLSKWGCGAINIDGCRVGQSGARNHGRKAGSNGIFGEIGATERCDYGKGRWPANVIHDGSPEVLAAFPGAPGQQGDLDGQSAGRTSRGIYGDFPAARQSLARGDAGSAARFFYCAKATRMDREEGLDHLPRSRGGMVSNTSGQHITRRDEGYAPASRSNTHPTVKPTDLMRWLARLVTPPGGLVLDPFMGSGSTGKAAMLEGFQFIGVEREADYIAIAEARVRHAWERAGLFRAAASARVEGL